MRISETKKTALYGANSGADFKKIGCDSMYNYDAEKHKIFTEKGQRTFLKVRDEAKRLLDEAGAFKMFAPLKGLSGDSWEMMAHVDRLAEIGEIREITNSSSAGQDRVFVSSQI